METPISPDPSDEACSSDSSIAHSEESTREPRENILISTFGADISIDAAGRFYWQSADFAWNEESTALADPERSKELARSAEE